uniref:Uncharacterized protein n=1 Tax=Anguilla anguilla TaxID=7936 RepID=A0A0E9QY50_ANGAN
MHCMGNSLGSLLLRVMPSPDSLRIN